jgi:virulence-associated protein VagC
MKRVLAFALLLGSAGCIEELADQKAALPLFAEDDRVSLPAILGAWTSDGDEAITITIRAFEGDYALTAAEKGRTDRAIGVRLGRIGGTLYWDATALPGEDHEGLREQHLLPLHSIARIRVGGDRLVIAPLRSDWVKAALADESLDTPHMEIEGEPLLTGSTSELQQLLLEHGDDEDAFAEEAAPCGDSCETTSSGVLVLHRVPDGAATGL